MCKYCEPDEAGNLKWFRDEPYISARLEEYRHEWGIVTSVTMMFCGSEYTTESYMQVNYCPKCGRKLGFYGRD